MNEFTNDLGKNNIAPSSPEYRASELHRRAFKLIHSYIERKWQESAKSNGKLHFIDEIIKGAEKLIPEAKEEINTKFRALNNFDEKNGLVSLLNKTTEITIELMTKYTTLEELEKRFKDRSLTERGNKELSRGLHFSINKEKTKISLHIPITFFENAQEFLQSFTEGLRVLAVKMNTDLELQNVKEVVGHSSLVKEKHRLLVKLGFEVTRDEKGQPTEETKISRERLLKIYGN